MNSPNVPVTSVLRRGLRALSAALRQGAARWLPLVLLLALPAARGDDGAKMTVIEFRYVASWIQPDSFDASVRKLWRVGDRFLRMEEPLNVARSVQGLLIANAPDSWVVDLVSKRARHTVDPGPTYDVIFPVFPAGAPAAFARLQMGREATFFRDRAATAGPPETLDGIDCDVLLLDEGTAEVKLWLRKDNGHPLQISLRTAQVEYAVRYERYDLDEPADMTLFARPEGVEMQGAQVPPAAPEPTDAPDAADAAAAAPDPADPEASPTAESPGSEDTASPREAADVPAVSEEAREPATQ